MNVGCLLRTTHHAFTTVTLRVNDALVDYGDIDFFLHPTGEPEEETDYLDVRPGDRLGILVPPR